MWENLNAFQKYDVPVTLPQLDIQPNLFKLYAIIWIGPHNLFGCVFGTSLM